MKTALIKKIILIVFAVLFIGFGIAVFKPTYKYEGTSNYYSRAYLEKSYENYDYEYIRPFKLLANTYYDRAIYTLDSMYRALSYNSQYNDGMLVNIALTKDNEVIIYDKDLSIKEIAQTSEESYVGDYTYDELMDMDFTKNHTNPNGYEPYEQNDYQKAMNSIMTSQGYNPRKIVKLETALKEYYTSKYFFINITNEDKGSIEVILKTITEIAANQKVVIYNPNKVVLGLLKADYPDLYRTFTVNESEKMIKSSFYTRYNKNVTTVPVLIVENSDLLTVKKVKMIHGYGLSVIYDMTSLDNIYQDADPDINHLPASNLSDYEQADKVEAFQAKMREILENGVDGIITHHTAKLGTLINSLNTEYREKYNFKESVRDNYLNQLDSYYSNINQANYFAEEIVMIDEIFERGKLTLKDVNLNYETALRNAYNEIRSEFGSVKTKSSIKSNARVDLNNNFNSGYFAEDYETADWNTLNSIKLVALSAIQNAETNAEIKDIVEKAYQDFANVNKKSE